MDCFTVSKLTQIHHSLVLRPSCVPENLRVKRKKALIKYDIPTASSGVGLKEVGWWGGAQSGSKAQCRDSCKCGNEHSNSIICGKYLD